MARPLRIEYPGACYHVINRGNRGNRVFIEPTDYILFIEKLSKFSDLFDVVVNSYCIMQNHFHLMLTTREANLSKFMQSFTTSFTISINNKYNKPGHLFQGRYKAQLVESELYKNDLSRYIHLNPIKIKSCQNNSLPTLKNLLHDYRWSSYRTYIGIEKKPEWLNRNFVLSSWGDTAKEKMNNYRKFTEEGLLTDNREKLTSNIVNNILGTDSFRDRIVKKYLIKDFTDIDGREQPVLSLLNSFSVLDIINIVSKYFELDSTILITERRNAKPQARKLAIYLSGKYCRKKETLTSLAKHFNLKISGFNMSIQRFESKLKTDKHSKKILTELEGLLKDKSIKVEV